MLRFASTIRFLCLACVTATLASPPAVADDGATRAEIAARLDDWKDAFNTRAVSRICDLYSTDLVSTVSGRPDEGRDAVCRRIANALADRSFTIRYALDLKEIIVSGDLAVVRLVWSVETRRGGALVVSKEPGLDVFCRESDGKCQTARNNGVSVGIIETPYLPMTWDWGYNATLGQPSTPGPTRVDEISPAFRSCAGNLYVNATDATTIRSAFTTIMQNFKATRLTH
jgi:ketosteroid isomerase-like protein